MAVPCFSLEMEFVFMLFFDSSTLFSCISTSPHARMSTTTRTRAHATMRTHIGEHARTNTPVCIHIPTLHRPDGLSFLHYDDDSEYGGDDEIIVNGYSQLFAAGKLDVSAMNIALAAHVTSIAYGASIKATASVGSGKGASASAAAAAAAMSGSSAGQGGSGAHGGGETASNVHVLTKDGREFFAELCIVTLPLPVLKKELAAGTSTLFDPPLPQRKQNAIGRLGASLLNKVMLRFDQAWWPKSDTFYHTSKAFPLFVNYFEHTGHPILVAFWSSTHAWESEALSDREIEKQCLAALNECLAIAPTDGSAMPAPVEVVITRWGSDPCSLGSYTHIPVGVRAVSIARSASLLKLFFFKKKFFLKNQY